MAAKLNLNEVLILSDNWPQWLPVTRSRLEELRLWRLVAGERPQPPPSDVEKLEKLEKAHSVGVA